MADYWIKFYTEILEDPKMATLSDRIWRRIAELFLVAGKMRKDGHIPDTSQVAWILRMQTTDLEPDMLEISRIGIIEKTDSGWFVKNFKKRQGPSTAAERKQAQRDRERSRQYNGDSHVNVTNRESVVRQNQIKITESESDTDTEGEEEPEPASSPSVYSDDITLELIYRQVTQQITMPSTKREDALHALRAIWAANNCDKTKTIAYLLPFFKEWTECRGYGKANMGWLIDWAVSGQIPPPKGQNGNGHKPSSQPDNTYAGLTDADLQKKRDAMRAQIQAANAAKEAAPREST